MDADKQGRFGVTRPHGNHAAQPTEEPSLAGYETVDGRFAVIAEGGKWWLMDRQLHAKVAFGSASLAREHLSKQLVALGKPKPAWTKQGTSIPGSFWAGAVGAAVAVALIIWLLISAYGGGNTTEKKVQAYLSAQGYPYASIDSCGKVGTSFGTPGKAGWYACHETFGGVMHRVLIGADGEVIKLGTP
jgi:hypothetical protein